MTVRKLDSDGDIVTSGAQFLETGRNEVVQTIKTRLRLYSGEYFRDITEGTPWFSQILGKGVTLGTRDSAIKTRISQTPNVSSVVSFDSDFDPTTREYGVTSEVLTTYGEATLTTSGDV